MQSNLTSHSAVATDVLGVWLHTLSGLGCPAEVSAVLSVRNCTSTSRHGGAVGPFLQCLLSCMSTGADLQTTALDLQITALLLVCYLPSSADTCLLFLTFG
jgi:hypothetical protein